MSLPRLRHLGVVDSKILGAVCNRLLMIDVTLKLVHFSLYIIKSVCEGQLAFIHRVKVGMKKRHPCRYSLVRVQSYHTLEQVHADFV